MSEFRNNRIRAYIAEQQKDYKSFVPSPYIPPRNHQLPSRYKNLAVYRYANFYATPDEVEEIDESDCRWQNMIKRSLRLFDIPRYLTCEVDVGTYNYGFWADPFSTCMTDEELKKELHSKGWHIVKKRTIIDPIARSILEKTETAEALINKGEELCQKDEFNDALPFFDKAIKIKPQKMEWIDRRAEINLHRKDFNAVLLDWERRYTVKGPIANCMAGLWGGGVIDTIVETFLLLDDICVLGCDTGLLGPIGYGVQEFCKFMDPKYEIGHKARVDQATWNLAIRMATFPVATFVSIATDIVELHKKWPSLSDDERAHEASRVMSKNLIAPQINSKVTLHLTPIAKKIINK